MNKLTMMAASVLAAIATVPAAAADITISSIAVDATVGAKTGAISYDSVPGAPIDISWGSVYIGRLKLTATTGQSFAAYCIDIADALQPGGFNIATFAMANATKLSNLLKIVANYDPTAPVGGATDASATQSAAVQLAVWEIFYEDVPVSGGYANAFTTGKFVSSGGTSDAARTLAQTYLNSLYGSTPLQTVTNYQLNTLIPEAEPNQQQIYLVAIPVPEPATWAMMISGFALVGGALRARRSAPKQAVA